MPKRIYLDQNVIVAIVNNERPGLLEHIKKHKAAGTVFSYSPAHIEEAAVILRDEPDAAKADALVKSDVDLIEVITDRWEFLPGEGKVGPSRFVQEDPSICMGRVIEGYDLTLSAEENERWLMSFKSSDAFNALQAEWGTDIRAEDGIPMFADKQKELDVEARRVSGLDPKKVLSDAKVLEGLRRKLWNYRWDLATVPKGPALLDCHNTREIVVNAVMKYLEEIGYRADKYDKYRSRMHDVTHAIYAGAADIFVTGDKRYKDRVVATYNFVGISTQVIGVDEFMALNP